MKACLKNDQSLVFVKSVHDDEKVCLCYKNVTFINVFLFSNFYRSLIFITAYV
jgi:hypothetical protein